MKFDPRLLIHEIRPCGTGWMLSVYYDDGEHSPEISAHHADRESTLGKMLTDKFQIMTKEIRKAVGG